MAWCGGFNQINIASFYEMLEVRYSKLLTESLYKHGGITINMLVLNKLPRGDVGINCKFFSSKVWWYLKARTPD